MEIYERPESDRRQEGATGVAWPFTSASELWTQLMQVAGAEAEPSLLNLVSHLSAPDIPGRHNAVIPLPAEPEGAAINLYDAYLEATQAPNNDFEVCPRYENTMAMYPGMFDRAERQRRAKRCRQRAAGRLRQAAREAQHSNNARTKHLGTCFIAMLDSYEEEMARMSQVRPPGQTFQVSNDPQCKYDDENDSLIEALDVHCERRRQGLVLRRRNPGNSSPAQNSNPVSGNSSSSRNSNDVNIISDSLGTMSFPPAQFNDQVQPAAGWADDPQPLLPIEDEEPLYVIDPPMQFQMPIRHNADYQTRVPRKSIWTVVPINEEDGMAKSRYKELNIPPDPRIEQAGEELMRFHAQFWQPPFSQDSSPPLQQQPRPSPQLSQTTPPSCTPNQPSRVASSAPEDEVCPICFESYASAEDKTFLSCTHHFHQPCLNRWLEDNDTCPVCRNPTTTFQPPEPRTGQAGEEFMQFHPQIWQPSPFQYTSHPVQQQSRPSPQRSPTTRPRPSYTPNQSRRVARSPSGHDVGPILPFGNNVYYPPDAQVEQAVLGNILSFLEFRQPSPFQDSSPSLQQQRRPTPQQRPTTPNQPSRVASDPPVVPMLPFGNNVFYQPNPFQDSSPPIQQHSRPTPQLRQTTQPRPACTPNQHSRATSSAPEDEVCPICLERYASAEDKAFLPCTHHFHQPCLNRWLEINKTCPTCRYPITT